MKQLTRNFRMAGLMALALMATAKADTTATAAPAAPAPKAPTAAQTKKAAAAEAAATKAAEKAKKAEDAKKAAEAKAVKDEQNGVTKPASGKTLRVWEVADKMSADLQAPVDRKSLTDALLAEGLVVGTIHTQYGKWRKYHGLVTEKAAKPAEPEAAEAIAAAGGDVVDTGAETEEAGEPESEEVEDEAAE